MSVLLTLVTATPQEVLLEEVAVNGVHHMGVKTSFFVMMQTT